MEVYIMDFDNLIEQYRLGKSLCQLSRESGISRYALDRELTTRGIEIRSRTNAALLRWQRGGTAGIPDNRKGAANTRTHKLRVALARMPRIGRYEREVGAMLAALDIGDVEPQWPVEIYNLDLAIPAKRIAVELQSCPLRYDHPTSRPDERLKDLLRCGWNVLYIQWRQYASSRKRHINGRWRIRFSLDAIRQQVVAFVEETSRLHSTHGQYRVVWGDGERFTGTGYDVPGAPRI